MPGKSPMRQVRGTGPTGLNAQNRINRPIVALGRQLPDGTIEVTDVLCINFPAMTNAEMAELSWKLTCWAQNFGREIPASERPITMTKRRIERA